MKLIKNSSYNLIGYIAPSLFAIPSMGLLSRSLGMEMFGILTLCLAVFGYAGIFDAGLTRALVRAVAIDRNKPEELLKIAGTAQWFILVTGTTSAISLWLGSSFLADALDIRNSKVIEALKYLSICIPFYLLSQVWTGYLEGIEKFALVNSQKALTGSLNAIFPAIFVLYKNDIVFAIFGLILSRISGALINYIYYKKNLPKGHPSFSLITLKNLLRFGGWVSISNILSPIMIYADRFVVSSLTGSALIASYTAPSEVISKMLLIPAALNRAIFPQMSSLKSNSDLNIKKIQFYWAIILLIIVFPVFIFSNLILTLWFGDEYAGLPSEVLKVLLIGFIFNSIAQLSTTRIEAGGNAKLVAVVHCIEIVPFVSFLYYMVGTYGAMGAAYSWTMRMIIDFIVFKLICMKYYP